MDDDGGIQYYQQLGQQEEQTRDYEQQDLQSMRDQEVASGDEEGFEER